MAMGALPRNILANVIGEGAVMATIGVTTGLVVGFVLARLASHTFTAINQPGVLAFIASAIVIFGATLVASAIPAMRAARVDAAEALRSE